MRTVVYSRVHDQSKVNECCYRNLDSFDKYLLNLHTGDYSRFGDMAVNKINEVPAFMDFIWMEIDNKHTSTLIYSLSNGDECYGEKVRKGNMVG